MKDTHHNFLRKTVLLFILSVALLTGGVYASDPTIFKGKAEGVAATPTVQAMTCFTYGGGTIRNIEQKIPMYSITQDNGWGANYVKLRDIGYYIDFDVVWDASAPNEMRIYTDRHYLDMWTETGPATEVKTAMKSTMDLYVDDVKVEVDAYMIDNNNYFKIRDLAKAVGFGCIYSAKNASITIAADYPYQDGDKVFTDKNYPTKRVINYQSTVWYDPSSGTLMDTPDVSKALSPRNPSARMNYWAELVSDDVKRWIKMDPNGEWASEFNARVQALADRNIIISNDTETIEPMINGVRNIYNINPYYIYPVSPHRIDLTYYDESSSISYVLEMNAVYQTANSFCMVIMPKSQNNNHSMLKKENYHETLLGIQEDTAHILAKLDGFDSDREKIRYLGEQVCARMDYAQKGNTLPGGMAALNDGSFWAGWPTSDVASGVCEHYVRAFERICVAAGYDYVRLKNATHSWDIVFIPDEAKWVVVDCTFADGDGIYGTNTGAYDKYLCCELEDYDDAVNCTDLRGDSLIQKTLIETAYKVRREGL